MLKVLKKEGFASFVEVIITAVIFVTAALGIFTSISMLRPHGTDAAKRLEAAYAGKQVLDELRAYVDENLWYDPTSDIAPGTHSKTVGNFTVNYYLEDVPALGIRQISMNVYSP